MSSFTTATTAVTRMRIIQVAGFAYINMTDVLGPPDKLLEGVVLCDYIDPNDNRGGGGDFGSKGSIPDLVE